MQININYGNILIRLFFNTLFKGVSKLSDSKNVSKQDENKKARQATVCWRCNGIGTIKNAFTPAKLTCPRCNGTGKISSSKSDGE